MIYIVDWLLNEADLTGESPAEVLTRYRREQRSDTQYGLSHLKEHALQILQEASRNERQKWGEALAEALAEGSNAEDFEQAPPYPTSLVQVTVGYHTGFKGQVSSIHAKVLCEDSSTRSVTWDATMLDETPVTSQLFWD